MTTDGVATSGSALQMVSAVLHKDIVAGAMRSDADVIKYPPVVNWKDTDRKLQLIEILSEYPPEPLPNFGLVL